MSFFGTDSIFCAGGFSYVSKDPLSFGYLVPANMILVLENVKRKPHEICTYIHTKNGRRYYSTIKAEEIVNVLKLDTTKVEIFGNEDKDH